MPNRLTRGQALVGALRIDAQKVTAGDALVVGSLTAGTVTVQGLAVLEDNATVEGDLTVDGSLVLGDIQPTIAKPGATAADDKDTEARAAIDDIIDALIAVGIIEGPSEE
jgi:hypothetical protein